MNILCLYMHYASPDCASGGRAYTLLRELGRDHHVTVLTTDHYRRARYGAEFPWAPPGVTVRDVRLPYDNAMTPLQRLGAYAGFPAWAFATGLCARPRPDVIYAISTPLTTPVAAAFLARYWDVPWVLEVRDLWPDVPIQMDALPSPRVQSALRWMERRLYRDADHIIGVSPGIADHIRRRTSSPVHMLWQGTDVDLFGAALPDATAALRQQYGMGDRTVILYAGALGRANAIPRLLKTTRLLRHRPDLVFAIVGDGYHAPDVQRAAHEPNVIFAGPQPRHAMAPWYHLADLSIVSFAPLPILDTNAPAKLFDSLAAETPVLVTQPGWMTTFVHQWNCGAALAHPSAEAMAHRIDALTRGPKETIQEAGRRGGAFVRKHCDRRDQAPALLRMLHSLR